MRKKGKNVVDVVRESEREKLFVSVRGAASGDAAAVIVIFATSSFSSTSTSSTVFHPTPSHPTRNWLHFSIVDFIITIFENLKKELCWT